MKKVTIIITLMLMGLNVSALTPWKKGAFETRQYRNLLVEMGYSQADAEAPRHGLRGSGLALACLWLACPAPDLACGQASIKDAFAVLAPFFTRIFLQPAPCPRPGERLCPARNSRPRHAKAPFRRADSRRRKGAEGESGSSESPEAVPRRWTGAPKGTERTRPLCRS